MSVSDVTRSHIQVFITEEVGVVLSMSRMQWKRAHLRMFSFFERSAPWSCARSAFFREDGKPNKSCTSISDEREACCKSVEVYRGHQGLLSEKEP